MKNLTFPISGIKNISIVILYFTFTICLHINAQIENTKIRKDLREIISINEEWKFFKYNSATEADDLIYDIRPEIHDKQENKPADARPTDAEKYETTNKALKLWILPTGNDFIKDSARKHVRPEGNPGGDFPFVQIDFDDSSWETIDLPHDWAIKGPFYEGHDAEVGGGMGRLPSPGVAWYRKKIYIPEEDNRKAIFLQIDGAMSYALVWLNGQLIGGWPYGYNSWQLNLTPYIMPGNEIQLAIRVDNPNHSSRWYPGGGIYRNVWIIKTNPVHVSQWGTYITTRNVSEASATVDVEVSVRSFLNEETKVRVVTYIYSLDKYMKESAKAVAEVPPVNIILRPETSAIVKSSVVISSPELWGPPPEQTPNLYVAVTGVYIEDVLVDQYTTRFGIRSIEFNPDKGIFINGQHIPIKGVNQHHDLGALGAALNIRAAERQLQLLREMGCNAIRMAHNPPAPELLELTDRMGFMVIDEIFDSWEKKKNPHDFHLIFPDWYEQDLRAFVRRDRNHPSVIIWSFGNEVGEQYTGEDGAKLAKNLYNIIKEEDPSRPSTSAMNYAKPYMPLPGVLDVISLNYQGEGIRQAPEFEGTDRIRTPPQYMAFHEQFPDKMILSSETASAFSSRGIYLFPVTTEISSPVRDGRGGDSRICQVSSYELYAVDFGSSADKVFGSLEKHPFVAGEFVWTGWDYLGEPTPYYSSRSSYCGIIDLAGFEKDRFYLYQSKWRPEFPMVHILPHWNWPERVGEITPIHVFTSGDEVELFLNGKSLGRKKKGQYEYRLRWDSVKYEPGKIKAIAYKKGKKWAESSIETAEKPAKITAQADRKLIRADGKDLAFIEICITDNKGRIVPRANNTIEFSIEGAGEISATDNGDPTDMTPFPSHTRDAFNGRALLIIRSIAGKTGPIIIKASSPGLQDAYVKLTSR